MHILEQLGVALGLATLAGVNLYLTVLLVGLAVRFDWLHLAAQYQSLEVLGHPVVLLVAGLLFCLEFLADKIPWVDSLWDSVHTFIRPVGGVLLSLQALGEMPVYVQVVASLVAGGAALTTHGAKAGTRLLVNHSPEPASNITMSVSEDVAVTGGVALTLLHPVVALGVFSALLLVLWMLFPRLWRAMKATVWLVWKKLRMPGQRRPLAEPVELGRVVDDDLRDLLQLQAGLDESEALATVPCLTGKCRGVRGLSANLEGLIILTERRDVLHLAASKGLSDRVFRLPLVGASVQVESRFLSENLILEAPGVRAVLRFPRGDGDRVETLAWRLNQLIAPAVAAPEPEARALALEPELDLNKRGLEPAEAPASPPAESEFESESEPPKPSNLPMVVSRTMAAASVVTPRLDSDSAVVLRPLDEPLAEEEEEELSPPAEQVPASALVEPSPQTLPPPPDLATPQEKEGKGAPSQNSVPPFPVVG